MKAREAAYRSLLRIETSGRYSNIEADIVLRGGNVDETDRRLYTRLVYGTIERKLMLDYILAPLISGGKPYEKLDIECKTILRLSGYQILFADKIPESAAVNEGVNLAKRYLRSAAPLVNAVLRRLCKEKNAVKYPDPTVDPVRYLSIYYSVSYEVCSLYAAELPFEECCAMLESMNQNPATSLRVNTLKTTREALMKRFEDAKIACEKTRFSDVGIKVHTPIEELPGFKEGLFFVQDEASQLAVKVLDIAPGMTVIDSCACPGGKSFGTAIEMENIGAVYSFDLHKNKLSLVEKGAKRLGIDIIKTAEADGRVYKSELEGIADRLICDLPCSGLGVLAKKPDIRYKKEEEMTRLPEIQWAILDNVCRYLKSGGILLFSTCTVLKRENDSVFERFKREHPEFIPLPIDFEGIEGGTEGKITLYPHKHGTDGFFISRFLKK